MLAVFLVVLAGAGTWLWLAGPWSLQTYIGLRRDDRLHLEALEDEVLDQYSEHGLPDR